MERNMMVMINVSGYVLPSLMNQIPTFRIAGCTTPQKEGLVTSCYTVAQWNAYAMYELTARLFRALGIISAFQKSVEVIRELYGHK